MPTSTSCSCTNPRASVACCVSYHLWYPATYSAFTVPAEHPPCREGELLRGTCEHIHGEALQGPEGGEWIRRYGYCWEDHWTGLCCRKGFLENLARVPQWAGLLGASSGLGKVLQNHSKTQASWAAVGSWQSS